MVTACLETAALLGGYIVLSSELLTLFNALTVTWVIVSWSIALILVVWYGWNNRNLMDGMAYLRQNIKIKDRSYLFPGLLLAVILGLLLLVTMLAPPNNNDSLRYHMARVVHWVQNQSLNHYPTNFLSQVMHSIGAEILILNVRLLWGTDQLANLVQYTSMLGVMIAVAGICSQLGARKDGHWLAIAFVVSLPIGILEATSTQNDYIAAFWLVSLLYFMLGSLRQRSNLLMLACLGIALGMGVLTKTTFSFLAILPVLFYGILRLKQAALRSALVEFTLIGCVAIMLNMGAWVRNAISFGSIFGQKEFIAAHVNTITGPGQIVSGLVKTISQNYVTPDDPLNARIIDWINIHLADPTGHAYNLEWGWNHEDLAGNPIHFALVVLTWILVLLNNKKIPDKGIIWYSSILMGGYLILATFIRYDLYGVRYQLPFLVAWAPVFAVAVGLSHKKWLAPALVILLLVSATPWVLFNRIRPLISMRAAPDPFSIPCLAGCTTPSILANPPKEIIFGNLYEYREGYLSVTEELRASGCQQVGLILDSHDPEYILWWLLQAPQSGIRIESLSTYPELERYTDTSFEPCAIICASCLEEEIDGLELVSNNGSARLYMESTSSSGP